MKKRILATLLFIGILLSNSTLMYACSKDTVTETQSVQEQVPETELTVTESIETERSEIKDNLPDSLDFNGEDVIIHHRGGNDAVNLEIFAEEDTGEVVVSAVYNRNLSVEDRLNIHIVSVPNENNIDTHDKGTAALRAEVQSNDRGFDLFANHMGGTAPLILEGMFLDLNEMQYLDWKQPWWNQSFLENATINNKNYFAVGDFSLTMIRGVYAMFVNKDLFHDIFSDQDIYEIVTNGDWTMDNMMSLCSQAYIDTDGNGTADAADTFGFTMFSWEGSSYHDAFLGASGVELIVRNDDDTLTLAYGGENTFTFVEKMRALLFLDNRTYNLDNSADLYAKFINGETIFIHGSLSIAEKFRDMEDDYGIIPLPKLDDTMEDYTGFTHNGFSVFAMPITCSKTDLCAAFLEAMTAESYRTVTPAYYEIALKQKYSRDSVSSMLLDQIVRNIRFDFGGIFSAKFANIYQSFRKINGVQGAEPASFIATQKTSTQTAMEQFMKSIEEMDN